jgi:hypothetical protein
MKQIKTEYPDQIMTATVRDLDGKSCLYVIEIELLTYKFGITVYIRDRLKKHFRDMNFRSVVKIFDCTYDSTMNRVENKLKQLARSNGELINKYNKTEIIQTSDINKYLSFIEQEIIASNARTQPKNNCRQLRVQQSNTYDVNYKCHNCGMIFNDNAHLTRHKNRKIPCLIYDVSPEHMNNPNRCIFCNKIFANASNKNKHLSICKIKNNGMNILGEKMRYEEKIHMLEEKDKHMYMVLTQMQIQLDQLQNHIKNTIVPHANRQ